MENKKVFYIVVVATVVALSVFGTVLVRAFWYDPTDTSLSVEGVQSVVQKNNYQKLEEKRDASLGEFPLRLIIPVLEIDAKVQKVGINKKGNMATPNNFTDVGWYKYGAAPGEMGSAVMAGHVDNGLALPGVFKHLSELKEGDDIYVEMDDGEEIHFRVASTMTYDYNAKPKEVFNQDDDRYLKLVTCVGTWMPVFRTHDKRLVVSAIKI